MTFTEAKKAAIAATRRNKQCVLLILNPHFGFSFQNYPAIYTCSSLDIMLGRTEIVRDQMTGKTKVRFVEIDVSRMEG